MDPTLDPTPLPLPVQPLPIQKRKASFWSKLGGGSLSFAIIIHLIVLIFGAFWIFQRIREPEKKVDFMPAGGGGGERGAEHKVQQKKRAQITPNTNVKRVFAEGAQATFSIPEQNDNFGEMASLTSLSTGGASGGLGGSGLGKGFGKGIGNGAGLGTGGGLGKLFGLIPENMRKRCTKEDRAQRLTENGGIPACEDAVLNGLRWLKTNQQADGSWAGQSKVAMTGLALLAYFGHCETPASQEFGDSCMKAIVYLVNIGAKNSGRIADNYTANHWSYEHAIATYALAEAATFCKEIKQDIPQLLEVTEKAGQFIIDNQNKNGGWAYAYAYENPHVDVSICGWQIQALAACNHTPLKFKGMNSCINKALEYLATCQNKEGAFGYTGPPAIDAKAYSPLTGVGMLCHQMWNKGNGAAVRKAAKYVSDNTTFNFNKGCNLYAHYYESQAMMQRGGNEWKKYNVLFRDQLLNNQEKDGSWKVPPGAPHVGNNVFSTCLCTLMLEVYYRFLSTGGGGGGGGAKERPAI
jgi:hypothetical protein